VKTKIGKIICGVVLGSLFVAGDAFAATQGDLDTDSEGSSDISVTVTEVVQITDIDDITVNPYDHAGAAGISQGDAVCVYTNDPNTSYRVEATGDGGAGSDEFQIESGANAIVYQVYWGDTDTPGDAATELTSGVRNAAVFENATGTYPCAANNGSFRVAMTHNNIMSVPAGTYSGTLTINLIPDDT